MTNIKLLLSRIGMAAAMLRDNPGFFQASLTDPWQATQETILYMCGLVRSAASKPTSPSVRV